MAGFIALKLISVSDGEIDMSILWMDDTDGNMI